MSTSYDGAFYREQQERSLQSASLILPHLCRVFRPTSAIDIGCGVGTWLRALQDEHGVSDIQGVDGDYVSPAMLRIPPDKFRAHDLAQPYVAGRKFDLAISVEVAEHLSPAAGDLLIRSLTDAAEVVIFSGALVHQTGVKHVNEQTPEYWAARFRAQGFVAVDFLRKLIWNDERIAWWYRQNILLFIREEKLGSMHPDLQAAAARTDPEFLMRVHPVYYSILFEKSQRLQSWRGFVGDKLYQAWFRLRHR